MRFLEVKNWRTYQHYSDRRPPWIKNHVALLDDIEYIGMSEGGRAALHAIWLLAARFGHPLPNDPKLLKERGGIPPKRIRELIDHGWLIESDAQSASTALAGREQVASGTLENPEQSARPSRARTRARERESTEREGEKEHRTAEDGADLGGRFVEGPHRDAYATYRRAHRFPKGFDAGLESVAQPITGGSGFPWSTIGTALLEMQACGIETFSVNALRGFCRRLTDDQPPTTPVDREQFRLDAIAEARRLQATYDEVA